MARPVKKGIDYFPVDTDIDQDDKIYIIEAELGEIAFGRIIKLLTCIYREGYFKKWGEEEALIFSGKKRIPIEEVNKLISTAVKRNFFDKNMYEKYSILTSSGIQRRYIKACEGRQNIIIEGKYFLVDTSEFSEKIKEKLKIIKSDKTPQEGSRKEVSDGFSHEETHQDEDNDGVFPEKTGVFTLIGTQKKRKESKINNNKININVALPQICDLKPFIAFYKKLLKQRGSIEYPEEFEIWWKSYPRQEDKKAAFLQWLINLEVGVDFSELQNAAENYKDQVLHEKTETKFIKHPKTFLGPSEPWREYIKARASPENKTGWEDIPDYLDGTKTGFDFSEEDI